MTTTNAPPGSSTTTGIAATMAAASVPHQQDGQIVISSTFWLAGPEHPQCEPDSAQCFKLLRELNGQVSAYHQLATALGTASGDGQFLRSRLKCTRRRARQMASLLRRMMLTMDNQESTDRLWCLLYSCLYVLALDMQRTFKLQQTFALHSAAGFINTGLVQQHPSSNNHHHHHHNYHHHSKHNQHEANSVTDANADDDVPLADRLSLERAEINQLQQEIEELDGALQELRSSHNLLEFDSFAGRAAESDDDREDNGVHFHNRFHQQCGGHGIDHSFNSSDSIGSWRRGVKDYEAYCVGDSDSDDNDEDLDSNGSAVKQRRCLCVFIGIVIVVFVLAAVLGASLAFQQPPNPLHPAQ